MKHVKFVAKQGDNTFELERDLVSTDPKKNIGEMLSKFFQWFVTMKNFKVETGFKSKEDVYVSIEADGKEIINTKQLASRFKAMTKFKLNRGERSQIRFTALMEALYDLAVTFDKKTKKAGEETTIKGLLDVLQKQDTIATANRKALREKEKSQKTPVLN